MTKNYLSAQQELDLIKGLTDRKQEAFSELYDRYAPTLLGVINKMIKDEDEAQDLLQDTMVKIWKNIHRHDPAKGRLFTWLLNITRNTVIDHLRVHNRNPTGRLDWTAEATLTGSVTPQTSYVGFSDTVTSSLSPKYWQVVDLIYFQGYSHQDAAEVLALPLGTVKTRVRLALQQLKVVFCRDEQVYHSLVSA